MVRTSKQKKNNLDGGAHTDPHQLPNSAQPNHQAITFWGTRGTMPVCDAEFLRYGGNTSCIEVQFYHDAAKTSIICDAGSGIIQYGDQAVRRGEKNFHVFLSHYHFDHIIGLLKFAPIFKPDCKIHFYGLAKCGLSLREIFSRFFANPFFPLELKQLPSYENLQFHELNGFSGVMVEGCRIDIQQLNHPQQAIGFRIWSPDLETSVVYATDHEHGTSKDDELCEFAEKATLLLYDTTFCQQDYQQNFLGWGHSTALRGAQIAEKSAAKWLGLFHHDPDATDASLEKLLLPEAKLNFENSFLCQEGTTLNLNLLAENGIASAVVENLPSAAGPHAKNRKIG